MRIEHLLIIAALSAVPHAAHAQDLQSQPPAQTQPPAAPASDIAAPGAFTGHVDFGFRGTIYTDNSDQARYQRYRDLRNGVIADALRAGRDAGAWTFTASADHIGYRDQRYTANYDRHGKLKVMFAFDQIPLFYSTDTATAYTSPSQGTLLLPDATQSAIQNGTATLSAYTGISPQFDLRHKRSITDARMTYYATPQLDLNVSFRNTARSGEQQWAGTFGFSDAVEVPTPINTNTAELGAAAEWTNDRAELRVGYDGSFFRNDTQTLVWDNPLRIADSSSAGPAQGRMALWPNSDQNVGTVSGLLKLPARSQATAYLSLGDWTQNQALIPFTINSALAAPPLDRATADAKANVTATAFTFNTRAFEHLGLNARFRSYDFNNNTAPFHVTNTVSYDTKVAAFAPGTNAVYSFTRKTLDLDASWTPLPYAAFRAAYTRDVVDQTFRTFDSTRENFLRLSADAGGPSWVTLRGVYEHSKRTGTGLDEQSLDDIGEQTSLRQFDISDRVTDRFSGIAILQPKASYSVNATAFVSRDHRPNAEFGLQNNDGDGVSFGFDYVPDQKVSAGASYQYERYHTLQQSRQASSGTEFEDPTRNWQTDAKDRAHTINASVDLLKFWPKTDIRLGYDFSYATSNYLYLLPPNTTLPPVSQLPQVLNRRHRITGDARYAFSRHLGANLIVWYETYHVDDFAFSPVTLNSVAQPSFLTLGYLYRPYTASTIQARMTYFW